MKVLCSWAFRKARGEGTGRGRKQLGHPPLLWPVSHSCGVRGCLTDICSPLRPSRASGPACGVRGLTPVPGLISESPPSRGLDTRLASWSCSLSSQTAGRLRQGSSLFSAIRGRGGASEEGKGTPAWPENQHPQDLLGPSQQVRSISQAQDKARSLVLAVRTPRCANSLHLLPSC